MKTQKHLSWVALAVLGMAAVASAAPITLVEYTFTGTTDPSTVAAGLTATSMGLGGGAVGTSFATGWRSAESFNTTNIDLTAYFGFSITPGAGKTLDISGFDFDYKTENNANAPKKFEVRYSLTDFATDSGTSFASGSITTDGTVVTSSSSLALEDVAAAIGFRIYMFGAASSNRDGMIDNVKVSGDVIPEPATMALLCMGSGLLAVRRRRARL